MAKLVHGVANLRKRIRDEATEAVSEPVSLVVDASEKPKKKTKADAASTTNKSTNGKKVEKKSKTSKANDSDDVDNVVYLGHVPNGFFETEIRNFFSQFGKVRRIKLFRSKKTGNSKGYAYVQFESMDVATVAAEAMDGYLFGDRKLVAHVVSKEKCHSGMFLPYKKKPETTKKIYENETAEQATKRAYSKLLRSDKKKMDRIRASGLEFEY